MSNEDFKKGIGYERISRNKSFHLFMGYGLFVFSIIEAFMRAKITIIIISSLIGILALYVGYSEKKELKKLR